MATKALRTAIVCVVLVMSLTSSATAGLISSVSYDQGVESTDSGESLGAETILYLTGTSLPVSQSLTASRPEGCSTTANYNFMDNGSVAAFNINCTAKLVVFDEAAGEGCGIPHDLTFVLSHTARYTATFSAMMSQGTQTIEGISLGLGPINDTDIFQLSSDSGAPLSTSGVLSAGQVYSLSEDWSFSNDFVGAATAGTGSDSVSLTITAIPEPSSVCLLVMVGMTIFTRRRLAP